MAFLPEEELSGDAHTDGTVELLVAMCSNFMTTLDSSLLGAKIASLEEQIESAGDDNVDEDSYLEKDVIGLTGPQIQDILVLEIERNKDTVLWKNDGKNAKGNDRRLRNALAAMDNTCNIFAAKHFPNLGPHVNSAYTKFFKEKFTTEIKSFLSNGNSALRYCLFVSSLYHLDMQGKDSILSLEIWQSLPLNTRPSSFLHTCPMKPRFRYVEKESNCGRRGRQLLEISLGFCSRYRTKYAANLCFMDLSVKVDEHLLKTMPKPMTPTKLNLKEKAKRKTQETQKLNLREKARKIIANPNQA